MEVTRHKPLNLPHVTGTGWGRLGDEEEPFCPWVPFSNVASSRVAPSRSHQRPSDLQQEIRARLRVAPPPPPPLMAGFWMEILSCGRHSGRFEHPLCLKSALEAAHGWRAMTCCHEKLVFGLHLRPIKVQTTQDQA